MSAVVHEMGVLWLDELLRWDDLVEVTIVTTDQGPFVEDFFYILKGTSGLVLEIPQEHAGEALLSRLQQLPGFDNDAVIKASLSVDNASFLCWKKP